jgi:hypothetical protein
MLYQNGGGPTLTLHPTRIENIQGPRLLLRRAPVRVMGELADYVIIVHNELARPPTNS